MLDAGIGPTCINKLFGVMDIPVINEQLLKHHERLIGPVVEIVAKESCCEATAMERALTIENIESLKKLL